MIAFMCIFLKNAVDETPVWQCRGVLQNFFVTIYLFQSLDGLASNTPNSAACIAKSESGETVANYLIDAHL
ncbi:hypothetical protein ACQ4WP_00435 [Janthinobacterium sp. GB4P2]|uniref:hypothetical protein n=1 Tax=Janthinobacterium sp. GB4P2 TaxID=3424189 RepID=UPI003F268A9E